MIRNVFLVSSMVALLAACGDGQPFEFSEDDGSGTGGTGTGGTGTGTGGSGGGTTGGGFANSFDIPEEVANNVEDSSFDAANQTFTVRISSLDSTPSDAVYTRNTALDVTGYQAYSRQEDILDRFFIGIAATSTDGSVTGSVVMDGGQFNKFFGGVHYEQNGSYSAPTPSQPDNGLVSYAGEYAGLTNLWVVEDDGSGGSNPHNVTLYDPTNPDHASINPLDLGYQPGRVTGNVFLNADFTDNTVNGSIRDRFLIEHNAVLPDLVLVPTVGNIDADSGAFTGGVENEDQESVGDYSGAFGGDGATAVAGGIHIEGYLDSFDNEQEYGVFVLTQCGQPGDADICDVVQPTAPNP